MPDSLTSSSCSSSSASAATTCAECALPVGGAGPHRATLLLPCQHVLHLRCVEYRERLQRIRLESLYRHKHVDVGDEGTLTSFRCPSCAERVVRAIPLFLGDEGPASCEGKRDTAEGGRTAPCNEMDLVFTAQQENLFSLEALVTEKRQFETLTRSCAALHTEHTRLQRELGNHLSALPSSLTPCAPSSFASVSHYSVDELRAFVSHALPSLHTTEKELLRLRREKDKKKRRLVKIKAEYYRLKAKFSSGSAPQPLQEDDVASFNRSGQPATNGGGTQCSPAEIYSRARRHHRAVVDVDAPAPLRAAASPVVMVVEDDAVETRKRSRSSGVVVIDVDSTPPSSGSCASSRSQGGVASSRDQYLVVLSDDDGMVTLEDGDGKGENKPELTIGGEQGSDTEQDDQHNNNNNSNNDEENGDDWVLGPQTLLLARSDGYPMYPKLRPRDANGLPRREEYLWQSTLTPMCR